MVEVVVVAVVLMVDLQQNSIVRVGVRVLWGGGGGSCHADGGIAAEIFIIHERQTQVYSKKGKHFNSRNDDDGDLELCLI